MEAAGGKLLVWKNERELRRDVFRARYGKPDWGVLDDIADARILIQTRPGTLPIEVDIEIDGQYYGVMLQKKIQSLSRSSYKVIYITSPGRAKHISSELERARAANISLMII